MKVSIGIGGAASGRKRDFDEQVDYVVEAEKLGVDAVWTAEAWGQDAIAPLAYLGAKTSRIKLGTGIMQISARAPVMTAMTALTMAAITNDRFILGLGASGPQVVEGLHGRPFKGAAHADEGNRSTSSSSRSPARRSNTTASITSCRCRAGRARRCGCRNPAIPTSRSTSRRSVRRSLEYTGAAADGWLGTSFTPEHADAHLDYLRRGAKSAGRNFADIDIQVGGTVAFGDDMAALVEPLKPAMAFTLGAMGSPTTNFYNDAYKRGGWEETGREVQRLWVAGKREEAIAKVPAEMVIQANLLGDEATVRGRISRVSRRRRDDVARGAGGARPGERLTTLGRVMDIVRGL